MIPILPIFCRQQKAERKSARCLLVLTYVSAEVPLFFYLLEKIIYLVLTGALITGHKSVSIEFFKRAVQHLDALLTSSEAMKDYSVATAAAGVVWQASYLCK